MRAEIETPEPLGMLGDVLDEVSGEPAHGIDPLWFHVTALRLFGGRAVAGLGDAIERLRDPRTVGDAYGLRSGSAELHGSAVDSAGDGVDRPRDILVRSLPVRDGHAHAPAAAPGDATEERLPLVQYLCNHAVGALVVIGLGGSWPLVAKAHEPLIDDRSPDSLRSVQFGDAIHEGGCVPAAALHQRGDAVAAEMANRGITRDAPRTP